MKSVVYAPRRHLPAFVAAGLAGADGWALLDALRHPGVGEWAMVITIAFFLAVAAWITVATYRHRIWISEDTLFVRDHGALSIAKVPLSQQTTFEVSAEVEARCWSVTVRHPDSVALTLRPHQATYPRLCALLGQAGHRLPASPNPSGRRQGAVPGSDTTREQEPSPHE